MGRTLLAIVGLVALLSGACGASAFTTYSVDPVINFDWTNGTFWTRCAAAVASRPHSRLKLAGIWYAEGLRSERCTIRQHGDSLSLDNGQGGNATGQIDGASVVAIQPPAPSQLLSEEKARLGNGVESRPESAVARNVTNSSSDW